ncbi:MAG: zinc ribbon domain-containing protein [Verrucomicrobiales bacterium]
MTYLYETIPANESVPVKRYEIKQSIHDEALTIHPETGESIRRVILGGWGLSPAKSKSGTSASGGGSGCGCGPSGCC